MDRSIPPEETLTVEFKSDADGLADEDLVAAIVCLANTEGGDLYLGVEDDGTVTGLHPTHRNVAALGALIANRTVPPVTVRVEMVEVDGRLVAKIAVPKMRRLVATSLGLIQRRRLSAKGKPECVPFYPHEFPGRQADLGLLDYSALTLPNASAQDFDPLARELLKQMIERYHGDQSLLGLADDELDRALGLLRTDESATARPTVAGMLLIGRETVIRDLIPTHEVAFQALEGTEVTANLFYRVSLVQVFEKLMDHFTVRAREREIQVGPFRVPIPMLDRRAFRETLANALIHRDYTRLGAVHVRWLPDAVEMSNPGGFVEGVTLSNLLVTEPRPRNPLLADIFSRLGLVERTGRGVDIIYQGMLRYGRPAPDYGRSDATTVVVRLTTGEADTEFLRFLLELEKRLGYVCSVDVLIALASLRTRRSLDAPTLSLLIEKSEETARRVLEDLVRHGAARAADMGGRIVYEWGISGTDT